MIRFMLPGIYTRFGINRNLNDLKFACPELFKSKTMFEGVYGAFPNMVWNGETNLIAPLSRIDIHDILSQYNMVYMNVRVSCTNTQLEKSHLNDRLCNIVLEELINKNSVEIHPGSLLDVYLTKYRRQIPRAAICTDISQVSKLLKSYYRVVLSSNLNKCRDEWDKIDPQDRSRVEILLNPYCAYNCEVAEFCRSQIHKKQLQSIQDTAIPCLYMNRSFNDIADESELFISSSDLSELASKGFEYFRIVDNGDTNNLISAYSYYFASEPMNRLKLMQIFNGWCGII